ncbi:monocarboxylate transporter 13-like isoform X1 [Haliotis rufescens]|uniref:monocarboxylate transporter 13-like isoform X1 n=1 Tax=Haliotis rufescens TaxID=6454 RepID=UPI00201ED5FB|nr:monocarboxylate transporter 13-like isoform X1 [Haliotis rufescens]
MSDNGVVENIKTTQDTPEDEKEAHVQDLLSKKGHISEDADSGLGWIIVFASFVNHVMFFGINLSFGVIYVVLLDYFDTKRGDTAWIGSIPTGILGIVAPVTGILTDKYGCRTVTMSGSVIASSGFVISSFAPNIDILYISYGVLVGIGLGLMYLPSKVIVNQYMKKRRSLANGICSSGGGVGTMAFAAMFQTLNAAYGFRGMFLISGAVVLNAAVCGALYRPKKQGHRKTPPLLDGASELQIKDKVCCKISPIQGYTHLLHNIQYCMFIFGNALATIGIFVPFAHLPRRARDLQVPEHQVAWLLPMIGFASVAGRLFFGWIGDFSCVNIKVLWAWSNILCGICVIVCPFLTSFPLLMGFAAIFGPLSGVWTGLKTVALVDVVGLENLGKALGLMMFAQGFSGFISSPLAGWLYDVTGTYAASFYTAGALFICGGIMVLSQMKLRNVCKQRGSDGVDVKFTVVSVVDP